jgi:hypothetical protein
MLHGVLSLENKACKDTEEKYGLEQTLYSHQQRFQEGRITAAFSRSLKSLDTLIWSVMYANFEFLKQAFRHV